MKEHPRDFMDYPNVRASEMCPLCHEGKDRDSLVCWSCYRLHDLRYGNRNMEIIIESAEERLRENSNRK